jgi:hypothetical protein
VGDDDRGRGAGAAPLTGGLQRDGPDAIGVGVEPEDDLGLAGLDGRGEPLGEARAQVTVSP